MFKSLGKIQYKEEQFFIKIELSNIKEGINYTDEFIINRTKDDIKVYNRICDHAGGKIISRKGESVCPIHNWKFNPITGHYSNGVKKKETSYIKSKKNIEIIASKFKPIIQQYSQKKNKTTIRFFNHAFLKVTGDNFSFSTDPWAIGPAFNTGWWLKHTTKKDWVESLNNSNFIYISHNHPDHLHPLTLSKINKDLPIIVPNFITDSTGKYIEELGFKNVFRLDFDTQYNLEGTELILCIFKSGDFREDSGIYFSNGKFTSLFGVDSNLLNFGKYPNVSLFANSFAGGASGYPLMFENYKKNEKIKILNTNRLFMKNNVLNALKKIKPRYFLPYAGFFQERLKRDLKIKKNNLKNTIEDYEEFSNKNNIKLIDVEKNDVFTFKGDQLTTSININVEKNLDLKEKFYLDYYKKEFKKIDEKYIKDYFLNSQFKDNLNLYILLTDDNFKLLKISYFINFSSKKIIFKKIDNFQKSTILKNSLTKKLVLKIRIESFLNTLYNKMPWEDLLIGFQCKLLRNPNTYNIDFWYHFTNIYITSQHVRENSKCNSCTSLSQFIDNQTYSKVIEKVK